tara:strand:- start:3316 stop:3600 length:285 start_codon:yes stop_codon:yes gene_type:complete
MTHPDQDATSAAQLERFAQKKSASLPRKVEEGRAPKPATPVRQSVAAGPPPAIMPASRGPAKQRERIRRNRKSPTAALTKSASLVKARTRKKQR